MVVFKVSKPTSVTYLLQWGHSSYPPPPHTNSASKWRPSIQMPKNRGTSIIQTTITPKEVSKEGDEKMSLKLRRQQAVKREKNTWCYNRVLWGQWAGESHRWNRIMPIKLKLEVAVYSNISGSTAKGTWWQNACSALQVTMELKCPII